MKTSCLSGPKAPSQTNEVRRSAALIAGAQVALEYFQRPLVLSELGASAGLNLMWDHYALDIAGQITGPQTPTLTLNPDWTGPCPPSNSINIAEQAGVDLNPLNPRLAPDLLHLTAYLWADQPYRLTLTKAAVATIDVEIEESDAIDWLATRFANLRTGHLHLIENTVAWQYFPNSSQARGLELIEQAGARATAETPLAWFSMENNGDATGGAGEALTLRLGPGDTSLHLGRVDFHGRWVDWRHSN
jgi:hypothetical protein